MGLPGSQSIFIAPTLYRARTVDANSDKGRTLFQRHQCSSCHSIAGVGGCLAPPLDGVGSRRNKSFILA
ncbi:cytochrome c, partial [Acinetobacter baumannii]